MREAELYEPVSVYLNLKFSNRIKPTYGTLFPIVAITATSGPHASGTWTRPDLSMVALWKHKYSPHLILDLYGFEVKTTENCNLTAVHETLAQRRFVNYAYLVWHCPKSERETNKFQTIFENCKAYKLGFIVFEIPENPDSYELILDAQRSDPAPDIVDEYIETRFEDHHKKQILDMMPKV